MDFGLYSDSEPSNSSSAMQQEILDPQLQRVGVQPPIFSTPNRTTKNIFQTENEIHDLFQRRDSEQQPFQFQSHLGTKLVSEGSKIAKHVAAHSHKKGTQNKQKPTQCPNEQGKTRNSDLLDILRELKKEQGQAKRRDMVTWKMSPVSNNIQPLKLTLKVTTVQPTALHPTLPVQSNISSTQPISKATQAPTSGNECPVCTLPKALIGNKACSHAICEECWEAWLGTRLSCPLCRVRVRKPYLLTNNNK